MDKRKIGENSTTFTYLKTGNTGNRSLKVNVTSYTNGDSHYKFNSQPVEPEVEYEFSVYYKANIYAEVDAEIGLTNGEIAYVYVGDMVPSSTWNKYVARFVMPPNAATASVYATVASKGYLISDDYSLTRTTVPVPFDRAIITLTYDELASTVYQYGYPLFKKYNMAGDIYMLSSELETSGMMSKRQLDDFGEVKGCECDWV